MGEVSPYRSHNETVLHSLDVGDLVEFQRVGGLYSHWGVFSGDGNVVHLAGVGEGISGNVISPSSFTICGVSFDKAKVCVDNFWTVAAGSKALKNNKKDENLRPLSPDEIVENALAKLGNVGYNLLFSNCEHFAKWCRYGRPESDQADNLLWTGAAVGIGTVLAAGLVYILAKCLPNDEREKKEQRKVQEKQ